MGMRIDNSGTWREYLWNLFFLNFFFSCVESEAIGCEGKDLRKVEVWISCWEKCRRKLNSNTRKPAGAGAKLQSEIMSLEWHQSSAKCHSYPESLSTLLRGKYVGGILQRQHRCIISFCIKQSESSVLIDNLNMHALNTLNICPYTIWFSVAWLTLISAKDPVWLLRLCQEYIVLWKLPEELKPPYFLFPHFSVVSGL